MKYKQGGNTVAIFYWNLGFNAPSLILIDKRLKRLTLEAVVSGPFQEWHGFKILFDVSRNWKIKWSWTSGGYRDPGFSKRDATPKAGEGVPIHYLAKISLKLHKSKENWAEGYPTLRLNMSISTEKHISVREISLLIKM